MDFLKLTDNELATYASGGYGPAKRAEFMRWVRATAAKAEAKTSIANRLGLREQLTGSIEQESVA